MFDFRLYFKLGFEDDVSGYYLHNPANGIIADISQLRPFEYSVENGTTLIGDKTFEVTVVKIPKQNQPNMDFLERALLSTAESNIWGKLSLILNPNTANEKEWSIVCKCVGITSLPYDKENGTKFVCKFYAPHNVWYTKFCDLRIVPSQNSVAFYETKNGITTQFTDAYPTNYRGRFALNVEFEGISGYTVLRIESPNYPESVFQSYLDYTYFLRMRRALVHKGETTEYVDNVTVNWEKKLVYNTDDERQTAYEMIGSNTDLFFETPVETYEISIDTSNFNEANCEIFELRGCPGWA